MPVSSTEKCGLFTREILRLVLSVFRECDVKSACSGLTAGVPTSLSSDPRGSLLTSRALQMVQTAHVFCPRNKTKASPSVGLAPGIPGTQRPGKCIPREQEQPRWAGGRGRRGDRERRGQCWEASRWALPGGLWSPSFVCHLLRGPSLEQRPGAEQRRVARAIGISYAKAWPRRPGALARQVQTRRLERLPGPGRCVFLEPRFRPQSAWAQRLCPKAPAAVTGRPPAGMEQFWRRLP